MEIFGNGPVLLRSLCLRHGFYTETKGRGGFNACNEEDGERSKEAFGRRESSVTLCDKGKGVFVDYLWLAMSVASVSLTRVGHDNGIRAQGQLLLLNYRPVLCATRKEKGTDKTGADLGLTPETLNEATVVSP